MDFGEIRAAFDRPTYEEQWSHLVWILSRSTRDQRFEEEALSYCRDHFIHWPREIERQVPQRWLEEWWRDGHHDLLELANSVNAMACDYGEVLGERLAKDEDMNQMMALYLWGNRLRNSGLLGLCQSEWPNLRVLVIGGNEIQHAPAESCRLTAPSLTHLNISHNHNMQGFLWGLLRQKTRLEHLELDVTSPSKRDLEAIVESGASRTLEKLSMNATTLPKNGMKILFGQTPWPKLEFLTLIQHRFDGNDLKILFEAELPGLKHLQMPNNHLNSRDLSRLLGARWASQLESLSIGANQLDDDAVELFLSPQRTLEHMWKLQMAHCPDITSEARRRLRNSVFADQCRILEV